MPRPASSRSAALLLLAGLCAALVLSGCDLFSSDPPPERTVTSRLVVGNGGNFTDQNGSLTFYDPATGETGELPLGAFLNSMTGQGGLLFTVLNTSFSSGRIDVVDLETSTRVGQVDSVTVQYAADSTAREALGAVRALDFAGDGTAYVTSFAGGGSVRQVRLGETSAGGPSVPVETAYPADVAVVGGGFGPGKVFVANFGSGGAGTSLSVLAVGNTEPETLELGCDGPNELFTDAEGELVVVCTGKTVYNDDFTEVVEQTNGQILFLDPFGENVTDRIELDMPLGSLGAQTAFYDPVTETLFALSSGTDQVVRVNTDTNVQEETLTVPEAAGLVGLAAVAYDARDERLYLARLPVGSGGAPDYNAQATVVALDESGAEVGRFTAGPSPSQITVLTVVGEVE